jgi:hypothetical protein
MSSVLVQMLSDYDIEKLLSDYDIEKLLRCGNSAYAGRNEGLNRGGIECGYE